MASEILAQKTASRLARTAAASNRTTAEPAARSRASRWRLRRWAADGRAYGCPQPCFLSAASARPNMKTLTAEAGVPFSGFRAAMAVTMALTVAPSASAMASSALRSA